MLSKGGGVLTAGLGREDVQQVGCLWAVQDCEHVDVVVFGEEAGQQGPACL